MNLSVKQKQNHGHRKQICGGQGGGTWERDGVGASTQAFICRMDKQQGPTVQHRELYSIYCDKP